MLRRNLSRISPSSPGSSKFPRPAAFSRSSPCEGHQLPLRPSPTTARRQCSSFSDIRLRLRLGCRVMWGGRLFSERHPKRPNAANTKQDSSCPIAFYDASSLHPVRLALPIPRPRHPPFRMHRIHSRVSRNDAPPIEGALDTIPLRHAKIPSIKTNTGIF